VNVDSIGVGAYFAKHLKDQGYRVSGINVATKPRNTEKYANLKAELYWGLRMRFETGDVAGLTDERAISQLATIRYNYNARGQLQIESKEEARQRGVKSPDRAEAIMLAYAGQRGSGMYEFMRQQYEEKMSAATVPAEARPSGWSGLVTQSRTPAPSKLAADDDLSAGIARQAQNLVEAFRLGHEIRDLDPDRYKSYLRPVLSTFSDPYAIQLMSKLDRDFRLT
jgi:hypothetical protein